MPVVDGDFLPHLPVTSLEKECSKIPILIGTTLEEAKIFTAIIPPPKERPAVIGMWSVILKKTPEELVNFYDHYAGVALERGVQEDAVPGDVSDQLFTESYFRIPAIKIAKVHHAPVFVYRFDWKSVQENLGACHAIEIPFVFGVLKGLEPWVAGDDCEAMKDMMQDVWLSFARNDVPSLPDGSPFPTYNAGAGDNVIVFGSGNRAAFQLHNNPNAKEDSLWE